MGIRDHTKTWRFQVVATPKDCSQAFVNAFASGGGLLMRARWSTKMLPDGAVAEYRGRKGLARFLTALSSSASREQRSAIGSTIRFEIEAVENDATQCAMWLERSGSSVLDFTSDARFMKPYMRAAEKHLRMLDSNLHVKKL